MELHKESIEIGANVKVTFEGAFYMAGRSTKGPWACLEIRFSNAALFLKEKWFQPDKDDFIERDKYAYKLKSLLDVLSAEDRWNQIPKVKNSWKDFYTLFIEAIADCRGKECYIKTLPKLHWKDKESYEAITADHDFISLSPTLEYSTLERNQLDYFSIEELPTEPMNNEAAIKVMKPNRGGRKKKIKEFPY